MYQMRELVDLRKFEYQRNPELVFWNSYKDGQREAMTVDMFVDGLEDYQKRTDSWTRQSHLHRSSGHMAKRSIGKTEKLMGGRDLPHDTDCPCGECGDWHTVLLDEIHDQLRSPPPDVVSVGTMPDR